MKEIKTSSFKKAEQIKNKIKQEINKDIASKGMDGNGRFPEADSGIPILWDILDRYGYVISGSVSKDLFLGNEGRRNLNIEKKNSTSDPFMPGNDAEKSMIVYTWYQRDLDNYEILSYLS